MRRRWFSGWAWRAVALAWATGCTAGVAGEGASAALSGTYWRLVELPGQRPAPQGGRPALYLTLQAGAPWQVSGHSGCNRISGTATVSGGALRFGPLAGTKMACADGMALESAYFAALEATRAYALEGPHLVLRDDAGRQLALFQADLLR